jgi:hypothetical protein
LNKRYGLENVVSGNVECSCEASKLIRRRNKTPLLDQRNDWLSDPRELRELRLRPASFSSLEFDREHARKTFRSPWRRMGRDDFSRRSHCLRPS